MIDMVDVLTNASVNSRNGLLAALEPSDFVLLHAHLRELSLTAGEILHLFGTRRGADPLIGTWLRVER